ncbi:MAG: SDR family oxidoreductase, partial [Actinomycetota bacterium]
MKIVVTGAGGQLGHELVEAASAQGHQVRGHQVRGLTRADLDVTDSAAVRATMQREKPDVIVHAAAWTAVDACEGDRDKAFLCNGTATGYVAAAAREVGARVVYISTDYVFDGKKPTPYVESDVPNPQSVYGASKLAGEQALDTSRDTIVRIS